MNYEGQTAEVFISLAPVIQHRLFAGAIKQLFRTT